MTRSFLLVTCFTLSLSSCAAPRPPFQAAEAVAEPDVVPRPLCQPGEAGGQSYCAITCMTAIRHGELCPEDLPTRTKVPGAVVCRPPGAAEAVPEAICAELPRGCEEPHTVVETIDDAAAARIEAAGMELHLCKGGNDVVLTRSGPGAPHRVHVIAAHEQHQERLREIEGVVATGHARCLSAHRGLCPSAREPPESFCILIAFNRRDTTVADLAEAFSALFADQAELQLSFHVEAAGPAGPRCEGPSCQPLPYGYSCIESTPYDDDRPRHRSNFGASGGSCADDGECGCTDCGNNCHHWTVAYSVSTLVLGPSDAYCGCVEGRCAWFSQ